MKQVALWQFKSPLRRSCISSNYSQAGYDESANDYAKRFAKAETIMVTVPITKEGKRIEAALSWSMEKAVKANNVALWAQFQEENAKNEKLL
ncbi:hypothetical protein RchiOBHm_Chr4g0386811 [Rosa chinensis]|uniref:Uncharacterized protein n=1 Tax=Rosa chinensis TaxID=74649 RepID=A0A2P6QPB5_ROSCH|nr:hypothetical protein RchiOBHm_Chr4g0386811 [Rosa chinensis]